MTKSELKKQLMEKGIESSLLDDTCHEAASSLASNANNGGLDSQIDFLIDTCEWSPKDILKTV
jgi:hypothetical protein